MADIALKIENVTDGFRNYGYAVNSQPVEGAEQAYYDDLRATLGKLEECATHIRKTYKTRGKSKRFLKIMHSFYPEPCWGVSIAQ